MLAKSYFETLESYLAEPHERHLLRAQELGRGLVSMNVPPEEVGAMHEQALERLEPVFGGYTLSVALHRTSAILLEVLMAYGLAFRQQIADLTRRERALRESEERFRSITRNVPGAIFRQELRANGGMRFPFVSHRYQELFGHSSEELMADASALARAPPCQGLRSINACDTPLRRPLGASRHRGKSPGAGRQESLDGSHFAATAA